MSRVTKEHKVDSEDGVVDASAAVASPETMPRVPDDLDIKVTETDAEEVVCKRCKDTGAVPLAIHAVGNATVVDKWGDCPDCYKVEEKVPEENTGRMIIVEKRKLHA